MFNKEINSKKIKQEINKNCNLQFYNLTPNDIDQNSVYLEALDYAVKNKDVLNIAVTGTYGAGKTSTIQTYEKKHPEFKYLNISLASFKNNGQDNNTSIERSILQQFFYTVASSKIPNSRFKRIKNINNKDLMKNILKILGILIFLFISIYLLKNPQFINLEVLKGNIGQLCNKYFSNFWKGLTTIILTSFSSVGIFYIIYRILKRILEIIELVNIKVKKENIEIEIKNQGTNEDSIFNKYLDEIIYFFEMTQYDVVVIEDLDRFKNSNEVFIKLRELNKIINNCETINKKIKFIYAIKDEIFEEKERTKFFDFILPIIPVINSSNSRQKLIDKLTENEIRTIISDKYIRSITLYIDDMRILNNIMNEFNIYRKNLQIENLNMENLFSIIVLKNIYPKEFAELQEGNGIIYNIFNAKIERLNTYKRNLEEEKELLVNKKKDIQFANEFSLKVIKQVLWAQIKNALHLDSRYNFDLVINGKNISYEQFISDSNRLEDIKKSLIRGKSSYYDDNNYSFDEIQRKIPEKDRINIDEIIQKDESKANAEIEKIENRINKIDVILDEIKNVNNTKLSYLILKFGIENLLSEEERKNDLVMFLLINGYLDETYEEYINYFYSGALKTNDKAFIISINSQKRLKYDYELNEMKEIIENLSSEQFGQKEILNFNLLDFILEHYTVYSKQLDKVVELLKNESEDCIEFCTIFIQKTKNIEIFMQKLCEKWINIWKYISENGTDEIKRLYLYNILKYATLESIEKINNEKSIKEYIEVEEYFIKHFNEKEIEKIKSVIMILNVKFENININEIDTELGKFIVANNFYKVNKHMVYAILEKIYKYEVSKIKSKNYTSILKTEDSQLIQYINKNFIEYVENVYLLGEEELKDNIDDIVNIINSEEISGEDKEKIIKRQTSKIQDISIVNEEIWNIILKNNKILETWDNVVTYYKDKKITIELIDYINYNFAELSKQKIDCGKKYEIEVYYNFYQELVLEERINKNIIKCSDITLPTEILEKKLSNDRIKAIIQQDKLIIDESVYELIRLNYRGLLISFIEKNIEFFIEKQNELQYDEEEIRQILMSETITREHKICVIASLNSEIGCRDKELAYKYYSLVVDSNKKVEMSLNLLKDVIDLIEEEKGLILLINQAEYIEEEDIITILDNFTYPYNAIRTKQIPKLDKSELNCKFVNMLKVKKFEYISSIQETKDKYVIYKKRNI